MMNVLKWGIGLVLLLGTTQVFSQTDKKFWFVAPEVDAAHGDEPIYMRFSTFGQAATVTVKQPANPSFATQTVIVPANSTQTLTLTLQKALIENIPANSVQNKGLLIESTALISAYYEVGNTFNPEIFPLKGVNALGTEFFTTGQNHYFNQNGSAAIDIVATENNTTVTIIPSDNIVGHQAGVPFTVTLNKGQTYSARALSLAAASTLAGTYISSNKPIAVTVSDDSIRSSNAWDLIGDQLVPTSIVGMEYIAVKGFSTAERVYIVATADNTSIYLNNSTMASTTINKGGLYSFVIPGNAVYIKSNKPIYAMHLSGLGDEFGDALLPPINCTGSERVRFVRSSSQDFSILVLTQTGNEGNFLVNGNGTTLTAGDFNTVPGTNGNWKFALKTLTTTQVNVGGNLISNTSGLFHLGILNNLGGSAEYGYFSNYSSLFLGSNVNACLGDTINLAVGGNMSNVLWNTGATTQQISVNQTGLYWVSANLFNCNLSDTVEVILNEVVANLGNDTSICKNSSLLLNATTPNVTYLWQNGSTNPTFLATNVGTYNVTLTDTLGCTDSDTIQINYYPSVNLGPNKIFICDSTQFSIKPNLTQGSFVWQDGSTNATYIALTTGTYSVSVTDIHGCLSTDNITLLPPPIPTVFLGNDTVLCQGDSLILDATINNPRHYLWSNGTTNATLKITENGVYSVISTDNNGCSAFDTIEVIFNVVQPHLRSDTTICHDASLLLTAAAPSMTYLWSTGATTPFITVQLQGAYWVEWTDTIGCQGRDTFHLSHYPVADLGNDIEYVCDSIFLPLDAGVSQGTFLWQDGSTNPIFYPSAQGTYWVAITDLQGCFSTDTVTLIPVTSPIITLRSDTAICFGNSVLIDATTPFIRSYIWQDGQDTAIYTAFLNGLYFVEVTDSNGCTDSDSVFIQVNRVIVQLGNDTTICQTDGLLLNAAQGGIASYIWHDGTTQSSYQADVVGTYSVILTDTLGCVGGDTIAITKHPTIDLGEDRLFKCDSTQLTIIPNLSQGSFLWQNGLNTRIYNAFTAGSYAVTFTDTAQCVSRDTIILRSPPTPPIDLGNDTTLCNAATYRLDISTAIGRSYLWQDGSTAPTFTIIESGFYFVEITDTNGCNNSDTLQVDYFLPALLDLGSDSVICENTYYRLDPQVANVSHYLWQDGSTTPTYLVSEAGLYWVELEEENGCKIRDSVQIEVQLLPRIVESLPSLITVCEYTSVILRAYEPNTTDYFWQGEINYHGQNNPNDSIFIADFAGFYHVTLSNYCGFVEQSVSIIQENCDCTPFVPNGFTPNGDGLNDFFQVYNNCDIQNFHLRIFDRWGNLLFESADLNAAWDGNFKGQLLNSGIYVWQIEYDASDSRGELIHKIQSGDVSLVR